MTDNRTTERIDHPPRVREAIDELMRKKDVTDNRATELLHKLLIARGVEFDTDIDECCYYEPPKTTWDFVLCGLEMTVTAKEFVDVEGKKYLEMDFHHAFTPEQAIAATLGSGTCHMSFIDEYETASGEEEYLCECSECGYRRWEPACDLPLFCSKCGKKVER